MGYERSLLDSSLGTNCIRTKTSSLLPPHRFADHLKNTEYKWPFWKHWANVVQLQPDNAQRVFVSNVLAALVKLSYADRYEIAVASPSRSQDFSFSLPLL